MVHGLEAKYFGKIKFSYLDADDRQTQDLQRTLGFRYQHQSLAIGGQFGAGTEQRGYSFQHYRARRAESLCVVRRMQQELAADPSSIGFEIERERE